MYELSRPDECSVGRAMDILGERWTFLILRESFYGVRRFSDMQRNLGIARNILSNRLQTLVGAGILERRRYQEEPERFEYRLTETGRALYPAIIAIMRWGDEHLNDAAPPVELHHSCGAGGRPGARVRALPQADAPARRHARRHLRLSSTARRPRPMTRAWTPPSPRADPPGRPLAAARHPPARGGADRRPAGRPGEPRRQGRDAPRLTRRAGSRSASTTTAS